MVNSDRPQWAERLRFWLSDGQYDAMNAAFGKINDGLRAASHAVETRVENGAELLETIGHHALCLWFGHKAVPDQCGKPDHDSCVYCRKSMPGEASERVDEPEPTG